MTIEDVYGTAVRGLSKRDFDVGDQVITEELFAPCQKEFGTMGFSSYPHVSIIGLLPEVAQVVVRGNGGTRSLSIPYGQLILIQKNAKEPESTLRRLGETLNLIYDVLQKLDAKLEAK